MDARRCDGRGTAGSDLQVVRPLDAKLISVDKQIQDHALDGGVTEGLRGLQPKVHHLTEGVGGDERFTDGGGAGDV
jgi:hypothetical protein